MFTQCLSLDINIENIEIWDSSVCYFYKVASKIASYKR